MPARREVHRFGLGRGRGRQAPACVQLPHGPMSGRFANFVEVFLATYVGGAACAPHHRASGSDKDDGESDRERRLRREPKENRERVCCATFDFDCCQFMELFQARPEFGQLAAAAPIQAMRQVSESLKTRLQFHRCAGVFAGEIFKGMRTEEAEKLARKAGRASRQDRARSQGSGRIRDPDPITAILGYLLKRPGDSLVATDQMRTDGKKIAAKRSARLQAPGSDSREPMELGEQRVTAAEARAAKAQAAAETMSKQMEELNGRIAHLLPAPAQLKPAPPQTPAGSPRQPIRPSRRPAEPTK